MISPVLPYLTFYCIILTAMTNNLTQIYNRYKGLWVALDKSLKTVVASGKNGEDVYKKAVAKGYKKPTLFKVPQKNLPYVGAHI